MLVTTQIEMECTCYTAVALLFDLGIVSPLYQPAPLAPPHHQNILCPFIYYCCGFGVSLIER